MAWAFLLAAPYLLDSLPEEVRRPLYFRQGYKTDLFWKALKAVWPWLRKRLFLK